MCSVFFPAFVLEFVFCLGTLFCGRGVAVALAPEITGHPVRVSGADFFFFYGDKSPLLQVQLFRHKQRARTNFSGVVGVRTFTSSCRLPAPARHEVSTLSFALRVCCFCRKSRIAGLNFCFSRLALLFKAPGFALIPCPPFLPLPRLLTCSTPFLSVAVCCRRCRFFFCVSCSRLSVSFIRPERCTGGGGRKRWLLQPSVCLPKLICGFAATKYRSSFRFFGCRPFASVGRCSFSCGPDLLLGILHR